MTKNWSAKDIPSQNGKIIVITGANSGLGLGTAKELLRKGAKVVMAIRDLEKGKHAVKEIRNAIPNANVEMLKLDLSDLNSVREFAETYKKKYDQLDILINNAGVMMPVKRFETKQGFEGQFGVNHLGHFVLTKELMPVLENTPNARIVTLSSLVAKIKKGKIYWDDLHFEKSYDKMASYAQSKLSNMMFGIELDRRLRASNSNTISVLAHPGYTATNLQKHMGLQGKILNILLAQKVEMGILPTLRAATDPVVKGGQYYGPAKMNNWRGYPVLNEPNPVALVSDNTTRLWNISEKLTKTIFAV